MAGGWRVGCQAPGTRHRTALGSGPASPPHLGLKGCAGAGRRPWGGVQGGCSRPRTLGHWWEHSVTPDPMPRTERRSKGPSVQSGRSLKTGPQSVTWHRASADTWRSTDHETGACFRQAVCPWALDTPAPQPMEAGPGAVGHTGPLAGWGGAPGSCLQSRPPSSHTCEHSCGPPSRRKSSALHRPQGTQSLPGAAGRVWFGGTGLLSCSQAGQTGGTVSEVGGKVGAVLQGPSPLTGPP